MNLYFLIGIMALTLQNVFYTLGTILAILNLAFLVAASLAAWYAYKFYTNAKNKMMNNSTLFMMRKIISNPMRIGTGLMTLQVIGRLLQAFRSKRKVNRLIG